MQKVCEVSHRNYEIFEVKEIFLDTKCNSLFPSVEKVRLRRDNLKFKAR